MVREASACSERGGTAKASDDTIAAPLVCCEPEQVETEIVGWASNENAPDVTEMTSMNMEDAETTATALILDPPRAILTWTGPTVFWGAPMTVTPSEAEASLQLQMIEPGADNETPYVPLTDLSSPTTFTPNVGNPGSFAFATDDFVARSTSFMIVPLPCQMSNGDAGYCRPRDTIRGALAGDTDPDLVCANGETAPCTGLQVGAVSFACCAGSASELQAQAIYRRSLSSTNAGDTGAASGDSDADPGSSESSVAKVSASLATIFILLSPTIF